MKTERLRGLNDANAVMLRNLHDDMFEVCVALLESRRYFILEDAIIRAEKRKLRDQIQWPVLVKWLEEYFQAPLASHHRASLRRMVNAAFNPLPCTKDVRKFLERGNGNQACGYGFMTWHPESTERVIVARYNQADGIHQSADRMRASLQKQLTAAGVDFDDCL
jgi:hypothetical protein